MKVRPLVSHLRSAVTALPTVCLFTLMSPAAMVTCLYLPSYFKLFSINHGPFYDSLTSKLRHVTGDTRMEK